MARGVSGLRQGAALSGVGSPLTMYPLGRAERANRLPLQPMLTKSASAQQKRATCRKSRQVKRLRHLNQKVRRLSWGCHHLPGIAPSPARQRARSYGLLELLRLELGNSHTALPCEGTRECQRAGERTEAA